jgi:hypothetical protein
MRDIPATVVVSLTRTVYPVETVASGRARVIASITSPRSVDARRPKD